MGSAATSDLALDLRPPSSPAAATMGGVAGLLREAAAAGEGRVAKLEEYLRGLEVERRKIDGFRRELPLCMLILSDVIQGLKEELAQCKGGGEAIAVEGPVLEEFMPVKRKLAEAEEEGVKQEKDFRDKVNWMSSAQLWSDNHSANTSTTTSNTTVVTSNNDASSSNSRENTRERAENGRRPQGDEENPFAESKSRSGGGAFLPFKVLSSYPAPGSSRKEEKVAAAAIPLPDLSLLSPAAKTLRGAPSMAEDQWSDRSSSRCSSRGVTSSAANAQSSLQAQQPPAPPSQQAPRKPRRCWSPELHRRFVKALQQLGGSQVATPKQIRDLMKVDGLTNDEVKSHLQKYRLHTRRMPTPSSAANHQQVVVLGGLWVSPENYPSSKQSTSQSGSPQGPLHPLGSNRPAVSLTGGDSCEDEDGNSESYSWKGHLQITNGEETD